MKARLAFWPWPAQALVLIAVAIIISPRSASSQPPPSPTPSPTSTPCTPTWQEIVQTTNEASVVWINFVGTYENGAQDPRSGTGFIVSSEGFCLTCSHVLPPTKPYSSYEAKVIVGRKDGGGHEYIIHADDVKDRIEDRDLALFKLPADGALWRSVQTINQNGRTHMPVMGLGFPLEEDMTYANGEITNLKARRVPCWLTSAPLNPGMSGGPIFDCAGAVIAVTTSGHPDAQLISEVMPITFAEPILKRIHSPVTTKQSQALQESAQQVIQVAAKIEKAEDTLPDKQVSPEKQEKVDDLRQKAEGSKEAWITAYKKFVEISQSRPGRQSVSERQEVLGDLRDSAKEYQDAGHALTKIVKNLSDADQ
jgi:S1-C subfamily serine protease